MSVTFDTAVVAGTVVQLVDTDGTVVASYETAKDTQYVVFSAETVTAGEDYQVYLGGSLPDDAVDGLAVTGDVTGATPVATVTAGEQVGGGMGGPGGGMRR